MISLGLLKVIRWVDGNGIGVSIESESVTSCLYSHYLVLLSKNLSIWVSDLRAGSNFVKRWKKQTPSEKRKMTETWCFHTSYHGKKNVIVGLKIQIGRDVSCYWNEGILPDKSLGYSPKRLALNTEYLKFFWRIVRNCFKVCLIVKFATIDRDNVECHWFNF